MTGEARDKREVDRRGYTGGKVTGEDRQEGK